ncbi:hypothetical protein BST11_22685 [Mycobacterium alsense]|uniref:Uncharacterized protein n=1 Tax=Mycobacterium alsense TaxID=324058 RepID=A0AA42C1P8_9MYCO|nr:hypothetical protein [Mycobacterium alsense]MCV7381657.1 hypothetical protein [Mycobacterium alsense]OQZ88483.1 hypothetical protein BST11_22685 [Mycobacterium alsense]
MGNFSTDQLAGLLDSLGERVKSAPQPDLRAAIGLVSDIGRIAISGGEADIRATQSALGALRERMGAGEGNPPSKHLRGGDGPAYLAGAMWALSEVLDRRLESIAEQRSRGAHHTRKEKVARLLSDALTRYECLSPSDLLTAELDDGTTARRDELSRALGAFIDKGWVQLISGDQGRKKFFALTPAGRDALAGAPSNLSEREQALALPAAADEMRAGTRSVPRSVWTVGTSQGPPTR